jgi:protein-disulfide isomerase
MLKKNDISPKVSALAILIGGVIISSSIIITAQAYKSVPSVNCDVEVPYSRDCLINYARELNLNTAEFTACLDNGDAKQEVQNDLDLAKKLGLSGTPSIFVGKKKDLVFSGFGFYGLENSDVVTAIEMLQNQTMNDVKAFLKEKQKELIINYKEQMVLFYSSEEGGSLNDEQIQAKLEETVPTDLELDGYLEPQNISLDGAQIEGNGDVTLLVFSDYQCPYCKEFNKLIVSELRQDYISRDKLSYVFRDFPLENIHTSARIMAEAARCAGKQNKYFEYHDRLFNI